MIASASRLGPTPAASRRTLPIKGREGGGLFRGNNQRFMQAKVCDLDGDVRAVALPPLYGEGGEHSEPGGVGVLRP